MELPIIIAIVVLLVGVSPWLTFYIIERRALQALAESHCSSCSTPYGVDTAKKARQEYLVEYREAVRQAQRQEPGSKIYFVQDWEIRCPQCGAEARFHFQTGSLVTRE